MEKIIIEEKFADKVRDLRVVTLQLRETEEELKDAKEKATVWHPIKWKEPARVELAWESCIIALNKKKAGILSEIDRLLQSSPAFREDAVKWIEDIVFLGTQYNKLISSR